MFDHDECSVLSVSEFFVFSLSCADINECSVIKPCSSLANCVNTIGSYECSCQSGYSGDGLKCDGKYYNMFLI